MVQGMQYADSFYSSANRRHGDAERYSREWAAEAEEQRRVNEAVSTFLATPEGVAWKRTEDGAAWIAQRLRSFPGLNW
jgi:regulator of protease activity HflC (stomatin/prohibitin superfamily)